MAKVHDEVRDLDFYFQDDSLILDRVEEWMKLGANLIGGCCTVGPDLISKIRLKIDECFFRVMKHRDERVTTADPDQSWAAIEKSLKRKQFSKKEKKKTEADDLDEVLENMTFIPGHMNQLKIKELMTAIEKKFEGT